MAEIVLQAEPRSVLGKKVAQLRRSGLTPANVYGHNVPSQAVQIETPDLTHTLRAAGGTRLVQLQLVGEASPRMVLIRRVSRKPTTDQLLHVEFYQVSLTEKTTVQVPIVLTGEAPVVAMEDAVVVPQLAALTVECLPREIPERIEIDISVLTDLHSSIKVGDITLPSGVTTNLDPAEVVVGVSGASREVEEEAVVEEEEAEAAAEPAAAAEAEAAEEQPPAEA